MLRPSKHSNPDQTVLSAAVIILKRLKGRRLEEFDELRKHVAKVVVGGGSLFLPALNLLYLLGLIDYRPKTDSFEYVGRNETL
jgi:hypothetical protein